MNREYVFFSLTHEHPIPVSADRLNLAGRCILVIKANGKFGRAANLVRRKREYEKTFGSSRLYFSQKQKSTLVVNERIPVDKLEELERRKRELGLRRDIEQLERNEELRRRASEVASNVSSHVSNVSSKVASSSVRSGRLSW